MDKRETFGSPQKLLAILNNLQQQQVSLLVDDNGLTRMEGTITAIEEESNAANAVVTINGADKILLRQIIAVNGVFRSDYSEC